MCYKFYYLISFFSLNTLKQKLLNMTVISDFWSDDKRIFYEFSKKSFLQNFPI